MKHIQYKHNFKNVFLVQLWHWNPLSVWEVKYLLGCISYHIFRTPVCVWNVYKHFSDSIKIFILNMELSMPNRSEPSACLQINWQLFSLACLYCVSFPWLNELIFLKRCFRADNKWVTPRNNCILAALLVTLL